MKNENLVPKVRFKGFSDPWEQRKWADLIDISTDMVDPRDVEFSELPHVGPGNIEAFSGQLLDNVNTVEKDHLISGKFHFYKGNIIYGKINPQLAKYIWADFEGLSSADTYVLTTKSANILNQGFIFYLLQTRNFYKYSVSVSMRTGMPKINRSELDAYSFLCPQSPEQIKIVQTIKILDDLIAANEDKLEQLKTLKKLMMQKIFSQKWRFKGFTDPWEQRKLGEMYYFKNGLNKGKEFFGFGTPIVNFVDVFHNRGLYAQNLNGRVNLTEKEINNFRVHKGDIFFTRTSETIEEIGFPSVMLSEPQDTVFSGFVLRGRSLEKPGQLVNIFKKYVFFTNAFRKEMVTKSSMTTRALTSGTALSAMRVKFPLEATEQKKIGELITRLDYLIAANEDKLNQLKKLKKYLMQNMFV
ncbi:restriction endonuclease subunit S [Lactiplantibacillus argentoratensis]|jgi:type I restriction enzyme S subunit|uniref:restriction endonuclease subunit S n=1 Tax=Lactiplantibacillus argentoratensis TaxID=271881 RepID=UPI003EC0DB29